MRVLPLLVLAGCSGTVLNTGDLIAARRDTCLHDVIGDQDRYQDWILAELSRRSIDIEEWDQDHATAWATVLNVPRGFWERGTNRQNRTLGHELVHYCQRERTSVFDGKYATDPAFQFKMEAPAYRQTARIKNVQRAVCGHMMTWTLALPETLASHPYTMGGIENLDEVIAIVWQESEERCGTGP